MPEKRWHSPQDNLTPQGDGFYCAVDLQLVAYVFELLESRQVPVKITNLYIVFIS